MSSTGALTTIFWTRPFSADSVLGVPGLVRAYRAGQCLAGQLHRHRHRRRQGDVLFRAAHDQVLPRSGPDLPNVPTYLASEEADRKYILENLDKLVVKAANESRRLRHADGTQGRRRGDRAISASASQADPRNYIAQPMVSLSRHPTQVRRAGSRAGTLTCGPTSSTARKPPSCPAA